MFNNEKKFERFLSKIHQCKNPMINKTFYISVLFLYICTCLNAQDIKVDTDSIARKQYLQEVVVHADYFSVKDNHIVGVPTQQQRKHAHTGYDLLRNMMLPGVTVIRKEGRVTTPAGDATIYINGREVSSREIESLRPQDIAHIEYYDIPTGKFAKDAASINYILKDFQSGGYTQIDAKQGMGFLLGNYNGTSKYSFKNYNLNVWAGYNINKPKDDAEEKETYFFPDYFINKDSQHLNSGDRTINKYGIASLSQSTKKSMWMLRCGIESGLSSNFINQGNITYTDGLNSTVNFAQKEQFSSIKPILSVYYRHTMTPKKDFDVMLDSYYSRNKYNRSYTEQETSYPYYSKEDYYYVKLNANYNTMLPHKAQLTFSLHEYIRVSKLSNGVNESGKQKLHSSETILFANYDKRFGNQFMLSANPGISYLIYQLQGYEAIKHVTPRINLSAAYLINKSQRLQLRFALGNTYPSLNTVNNTDQQIDRFMIRRGNVDMDNSIVLQPMLNYMYNSKKISIGLTGSYMYLNHAIVNDYLAEGNKIVNTYSSDDRYRASTLSLSTSYKPASYFNLKIDCAYKHTDISGSANMRQNSLKASLLGNWYVKDFLFSMSCEMPQKEIMNNQIYVQTPWEYDMGVEWSHKNIAIEVVANNLFLKNNKIVKRIDSDHYKFQSSLIGDLQNQYLTAKVSLTIDYGKDVNKSPEYNLNSSESAIMRGKI